MTIKALLFDMGNVLIEINFQKMMGSFGKNFSDETSAAAYVEAWKFHDLYERGHLSTEDFLNQANAALNLNLTLDQFSKCWNDIYVREVEGVNQLLIQLKQKYPLYLLSNTNFLHIEYCRKNFRVLQHFNHKFFSYELGARKPEFEILQKVADHIKLSPHEILFFDDLKKNVESAQKFGMKSEVAMQSSLQIIAGLAKHGVMLNSP